MKQELGAPDLSAVSRTRRVAAGMTFTLIAWGLAVAGIAGCSATTPVLVYDTSGATEEKAVDTRLFYVVQGGDTLTKISRLHETNWKTLATLNKLNEPDNIIPGMRLLIYPGYHLSKDGQLVPAIKFAESVPSNPVDLEDAAAAMKRRQQRAAEKAKADSKPDLATAQAPEEPADTPAVPVPAKREPPPTIVAAPSKPQKSSGASKSASKGKPGWQWPVRVRPKFGFTPAREGVDYVVPRGTNIVAAASGRAEYVGTGLIDFKHYVILYHNDGYVSIYGFNVDPVVREEEQVNRGDRIATVNAVEETDRRFHFEIRKKGGNPVNPSILLPGY